MFNFSFSFFKFFSELTVPTVVVLNTSNQQYFLLDRHIKEASDMVQFINSILDGTVQVSSLFLFQTEEEVEDKPHASLPLILKGIVNMTGGRGNQLLPSAFLSHSISPL